MNIASTKLVELTAGDIALALAPAVGGGVARFAWRGQDLLRPASPEGLATVDPLCLGNFPLVPFAGRITQGRFTFGGRHVILPANLAGEPAAIHGQGWRLPWEVADLGEAFARLSLDHPAGAWPWEYRADQIFTIDDTSLTHTIAVTNLSPEPMPAGLGLHPYFPRRPDTRLRTATGGVFLTPVGAPVPPPPAWDWSTGPEITAFVDNQFDAWSGEARIEWPSRNLSLTMRCETAAPRLVVFAPNGEDCFCVEPVSHQLDAVNLSDGGRDHGMVLLGQGETTKLTLRLTVSTLVA